MLKSQIPSSAGVHNNTGSTDNNNTNDLMKRKKKVIRNKIVLLWHLGIYICTNASLAYRM